ncbi:MAG: hypothetical protein ABIH41_06355 [Nanoarchaeota archaeon]
MATKTAHKTLTNDQMLTGILSYLSILVIIPLIIVKRRDDFIRFHLQQGIVLFVAELIVFVALGALTVLIPFLFVISNIMSAVFLIVSIIAIVYAVQGEQWKIPWISDYAKKVKL